MFIYITKPLDYWGWGGSVQPYPRQPLCPRHSLLLDTAFALDMLDTAFALVTASSSTQPSPSSCSTQPPPPRHSLRPRQPLRPRHSLIVLRLFGVNLNIRKFKPNQKQNVRRQSGRNVVIIFFDRRRIGFSVNYLFACKRC